MKKKTIYWLSDSPFTNTGFSSQSLFLMNGLADKGYDIHYQAHNYVGQTLPKGSVTLADGTPFKFTLYGNCREAYSKDVIVPRIRQIKPDVFGVLLDTFMLYPWYLQNNFAPAKSVWWYPSDGGGGLPFRCEQILQKCDHPIAMAEFGQKQVKDQYNIDSEFIPHAVDEKNFRPLPFKEKEKIKATYNMAGKYVVGLMGRNQGRKMHDRAIKMFAKWCKDKPDAVMFLHLDPNDPAAVFDVRSLANKLGIMNRMRFSGNTFANGFIYKKMNEIFNVMDVYISSTSGEGFGVGTIEAMACGIPCLITAYTTTDELVVNNQAGESIKLVGCEHMNVFDHHINKYDYNCMNGSITGSWSVERGLMDIDHGVIQMNKLYKDKELREFYGKNGRKAVLEKYTWKVVIDKWDKMLSKL